MPTKKDKTWEYRRVYNVDTYDLGEVAGHPFSYVKRRHFLLDKDYRNFKPFCKCGWKSSTWHTSKKFAHREHFEHAKQYEREHPRLFDDKDDA